MSLYWNEARVVVREAGEGALPAGDAVAIELGREALDDGYLMRLLRAFVLTRALEGPRGPASPVGDEGEPSGPAWDEPATEGGDAGADDFDRAFMEAWDEAEEAWARECEALDGLLLAGGSGDLPPFSAQIQVFVGGCEHVTVTGEA